MMKTPILSICIPTYNRAEYLRDALANLAEQLVSLPDQTWVELLVVDNASTDHTQTVIKQFSLKYPHIQLKMEARPYNIGADNVYLCSVNATGNYVFLLSDDDFLLPNTLNRFFEVISSHPNVDGVLFNLKSFKKNVDNLSAPMFDWQEDAVLQRDEVLSDIGAMITYMSILIFKRQLIEKVNYSFAMNKNLIQSYAFIDVLNKGLFFYKSSHFSIAYRDDNSIGWNFFKVMATQFNELLEYASTLGFDPKAIKKSRFWMLRLITATVAYHKSKGSYGSVNFDYRDGLVRLIKVYSRYLFFWIITAPLMLLPRRFATAFHTLSALPRNHSLKQALRKWRII